MKETRADTQRALLEATGLHVLLFALLFAGLNWTRTPVAEAAHGEVIEADLVDPSELSQAMRSAMARAPEALPQPVAEPDPAPVPDPLPEPMVEPAPTPPAPVPDPQPVEQEKVQRDAVAPDVAKVPEEQEQKRKQPPQVDLSAEKQVEADRKKQQLAEIRRQRELAARERTQAEMRAQQLADAKAAPGPATRTPPAGNPDSRASQRAAYIVALRDAILRQWTRPESVKLDQECQVLIRQIPGGEVVSVDVAASCPYDELGRRSVEAAVLKASPLPYAGFESEFVRDPVLKFRARDAMGL